MLEVPSRERLQQLTEAVRGIVPVVALGFVRPLEGGRVSVFYSYVHGVGELDLAAEEVLDVLQPTSGSMLEAGREELEAGRGRAVESFLLDNGAVRIASFPLATPDHDIRFWIGFSAPDELHVSGLDDAARHALAALAEGIATEAVNAPSDDVLLARLRRLEQAAGLIPALHRVLDVREVIDRLSATAKLALPHDLLLLNLFSEDLKTFTVYARSDRGAMPSVQRRNEYPVAALHAWVYSIIDDQTLHPFERHTPATLLGVRSTMRFPIRFDDRLIGGVAFASFTPRAFSAEDVPVGKRLADHVASAISHFKLAERLAEQARQTEVLRTRTTTLELLDQLLATMTEPGTVEESFESMSAVARKVLPHDALALPVLLDNGRTARRYAASGLGVRPPEIVDVPEYFQDPSWEFDVIEDVTAAPGAHNARVAGMGFLSALRVPIHLDGRLAAALVFLSKSRAAFGQSDILVARRLADRLSVTLARDSRLEASRRADEATERAAKLEARVRTLTEELDARTGYRRVVGTSAPWRQVLTQATQVASTETTVLLLGESGTGKEVVARFVHRGSSRKQGPFIALNCAALPEQLLEAELFGYERGAYTGATQSKPGQLEQAAGGTLFLDEVGEMNPSAQAKFLRVLQEREFQRLGGTRVLRTDARIIAATNRDLPKAIAGGQFREDLYYRLNVFAIRLPALRDRRDDILPLSEAFLAELGRTIGRPSAGISSDAREMLITYQWPGNVRELRNILERATILCDGGLITADHLGLPIAAAAGADILASMPPVLQATMPGGIVPESVGGGSIQTMERTLIEQALQAARFNKSKAAKALGLTRHQLYIRMRRYGFD